MTLNDIRVGRAMFDPEEQFVIEDIRSMIAAMKVHLGRMIASCDRIINYQSPTVPMVPAVRDNVSSSMATVSPNLTHDGFVSTTAIQTIDNYSDANPPVPDPATSNRSKSSHRDSDRPNPEGFPDRPRTRMGGAVPGLLMTPDGSGGRPEFRSTPMRSGPRIHINKTIASSGNGGKFSENQIIKVFQISYIVMNDRNFGVPDDGTSVDGDNVENSQAYSHGKLHSGIPFDNQCCVRSSKCFDPGITQTLLCASEGGLLVGTKQEVLTLIAESIFIKLLVTTHVGIVPLYSFFDGAGRFIMKLQRCHSSGSHSAKYWHPIEGVFACIVVITPKRDTVFLMLIFYTLHTYEEWSFGLPKMLNLLEYPAFAPIFEVLCVMLFQHVGLKNIPTCPLAIAFLETVYSDWVQNVLLNTFLPVIYGKAVLLWFMGMQLPFGQLVMVYPTYLGRLCGIIIQGIIWVVLLRVQGFTKWNYSSPKVVTISELQEDIMGLEALNQDHIQADVVLVSGTSWITTVHQLRQFLFTQRAATRFSLMYRLCDYLSTDCKTLIVVTGPPYGSPIMIQLLFGDIRQQQFYSRQTNSCGYGLTGSCHLSVYGARYAKFRIGMVHSLAKVLSDVIMSKAKVIDISATCGQLAPNQTSSQPAFDQLAIHFNYVVMLPCGQRWALYELYMHIHRVRSGMCFDPGGHSPFFGVTFAFLAFTMRYGLKYFPAFDAQVLSTASSGTIHGKFLTANLHKVERDDFLLSAVHLNTYVVTCAAAILDVFLETGCLMFLSWPLHMVGAMWLQTSHVLHPKQHRPLRNCSDSLNVCCCNAAVLFENAYLGSIVIGKVLECFGVASTMSWLWVRMLYSSQCGLTVYNARCMKAQDGVSHIPWHIFDLWPHYVKGTGYLQSTTPFFWQVSVQDVNYRPLTFQLLSDSINLGPRNTVLTVREYKSVQEMSQGSPKFPQIAVPMMINCQFQVLRGVVLVISAHVYGHCPWLSNIGDSVDQSMRVQSSNTAITVRYSIIFVVPLSIRLVKLHPPEHYCVLLCLDRGILNNHWTPHGSPLLH